MPLRKMQAVSSPSVSETYYISPLYASPSNSPIFSDATYYFTGTPSPSPIISSSPSPIISSSPVFSTTVISANESDILMFPSSYR